MISKKLKKLKCMCAYVCWPGKRMHNISKRNNTRNDQMKLEKWELKKTETN